ncbi:MAG: nuclear transport factor 2 family protein, partial [Acidobacteriota bacterium]
DRDMTKRLKSARFVLLFVVGALVSVGPILAAGEMTAADREALARDYFKALESLDWDKQATFYTEESVFEDPTSVMFGEPWHFVGPEAIVEFWRSSTESSGTIEVKHDIQRLFVSGPYVVIDFASTVRLTAVMIGFPDEEISSVIEVSTVLRIDDGKVLHHLDHADYETAWADLQAIQARLESEASAE